MEKWHTYVLLAGKDEEEEEQLDQQTGAVTADFRKLHMHSHLHKRDGWDILFMTVALIVVKPETLASGDMEILKPLILENRDRVILFVEDALWNATQHGFNECTVIRSLVMLNATIEFRLGELKKLA